jgi:hypothetical protein
VSGGSHPHRHLWIDRERQGQVSARFQAVGSSSTQSLEALLRHLTHMFVLIVLDDALQQLFVFAFEDGLLANLGIGPRDLGDEKIAELHQCLLSMILGVEGDRRLRLIQKKLPD